MRSKGKKSKVEDQDIDGKEKRKNIQEKEIKI